MEVPSPRPASRFFLSVERLRLEIHVLDPESESLLVVLDGDRLSGELRTDRFLLRLPSWLEDHQVLG